MVTIHQHEDKTQKKENSCKEHKREFAIIISRWTEQIAQPTQASNSYRVNEHDGKAQ
jgi:hypothetical protein